MNNQTRLVFKQAYKPYLDAKETITTENNDVFELYLSYLRDYCNSEPVISESGTKKLTAYLRTDEEKEKVKKILNTAKEKGKIGISKVLPVKSVAKSLESKKAFEPVM